MRPSLIDRFSRVLFIVSLVAVGCNSGGRKSSPPPPPPPPSCAEGQAQLLTGPVEGCAGDILELEVLNVGTSLLDNLVVFRSTGADPVELMGVVTEIENLGQHPQRMCPWARLSVAIPSGARHGTITLYVRNNDGTIETAGAIAYTGCPEISGYIVGTSGSFLLDAGGVITPDEVIDYGFNFSDVTAATVVHPGPAAAPQTFAGLGVTQVFPANLPPGMDALSIDLAPVSQSPILPPGFFFNLQVELVAVGGGAVGFTSNAIDIPVRAAFAPGDFEDMPATITGVLLPTGVHTGVIEIKFTLKSMPANARYDLGPATQLGRLVPQWTDSNGNTGACTPVGDSGLKLITGVETQASAYPAILVGGASHTFLWESARDIFPSTLSATPQPEWVVITLQPANDLPDVTVASSGVFTTGRIVILNEALDTPYGDGVIAEAFV